jgi:formate hydrogenlyase subunit 3/multisubunit Na+/H+ antiporter MnhD subunit
MAAIPLLPLLAAAALLINLAAGEPLAEKGTQRLASAALAASFLLAAWVFAGQAARPAAEVVRLGRWLYSGDYRVDLELLIDPLSSTMMLLTSGFGLLVARFSKNYLHRESGFGRFYAVLSLFIAAMLLLVMGGNLVVTFAGWEGVGLCSYLLIGFYYDRKAPASAATRAFITNRVGDAGFLLAVFVAFSEVGAIDYRTLSGRAGALGAADPTTAALIALGLLLAAAGKSAQLPLSPWLARAMEGPTPSSALFYAAVMVNAGVYLVVRNQALFDASPAAMWAMAIMGGATALYGGLVSLVQTDVKGALIFSTTGQLGLMFLACGLGYTRLATAHLVAHALLRGLQFLAAPSILLRQRPGAAPRSIAPRGAWLALLAPAEVRRLHAAALHRLWLDDIHVQWIARPILRLARALARFDAEVVDRAVGRPLPVRRAPPATAVWDDAATERTAAHGHGRKSVAPAKRPERTSTHATGLAGQLVNGLSSIVQTVEEHFVSRALGRGIPVTGKLLGRALNRVDDTLGQPLVAGALIALCIAVVLRGAL